MTSPLLCTDCHAAFEFGEGERKFFATRGLVELPRRCPACRDARKRRERARFGQRTEDDPRRNSGNRAAEPGEALAAESLCASCGLPADVAFRPAIGRPVYCQQCYNLRQKDGAGCRG